MTFPKTTWCYSQETEALRILQIAYHIRSGFYQDKGFFVLPYAVSGNPRAICFPDLSYTKIPNFWKKAKKTSEELFKKKDEVISEIVNMLPKEEMNVNLQKKQWQNAEKKFWQIFKRQNQNLFSSISSLEIRPTRYGAVCTAYSTWIADPRKIIIYLRKDCDFSHIAEGIFLDRLHRLHDTEYSWDEIEAIIDYFLSKSELSNLFPNYRETTSSLRQKQQGKLALDAKKYIQNFGFIKKISLDKIPLNLHFSDCERRIFQLLLQKKNEVVSFDEMADAMWASNSFDKYSEYAMVKMIQRLREKLERKGFSSEIIQTIKKQGYVLVVS